MSFSKSTAKRFNDITSCAPPPGTYDVKFLQKSAGLVVFDKSNRFKDLKESLSSTCELDSSTCSSYVGTPTKKLFASPYPLGHKSLTRLNKKVSASCENISSSKPDDVSAELETKDLIITELQLKLKCLEDELVIVKSDIETPVDNATVVEHEKEELACSEETHFQALVDKFKEEIENLQQKLAEREQTPAEVCDLELMLNCRVKTLEADLEESVANIAALKETNQSLIENKDEAMDLCEEVELQVIQFQALNDGLRLENCSLQQKLIEQEQNNMSLQSELTMLNIVTDDKIAEIRETLQVKLKHSLLQQEELQQQIEDGRGKFDETFAENILIKDERASLEEQISSLHVRVSHLMSDSHIKDTLITGLEKQINDLEAVIDRKKKKVPTATLR